MEFAVRRRRPYRHLWWQVEGEYLSTFGSAHNENVLLLSMSMSGYDIANT
jgi:hypothetical protein